MQAFRAAVFNGFRAALRLRPLLPLYVCNVIIGLVQTWPLWTAGNSALRNPFLNDLTTGGTDALVNLFLNNTAAVGPAVGWSFLIVPLTLLSGLAYSFFAGGIISKYAGGRRFWAGCRHFFWSFVGLGLLLIVLAGVIIALAAVIAGFGGGMIALVGALVGIAVINVIGEFARAIAVVHDRRNPLALIGLAGAFCARHFVGVSGIALLGLMLHGSLSALYLPVAGTLRGSPAVIVWQQLCVFGWLWIKGLRLAWAVHYVRADEYQRAHAAATLEGDVTYTAIPQP